MLQPPFSQPRINLIYIYIIYIIRSLEWILRYVKMRFPVARLTSFRRCSLVRDAKEVAKNGLGRTWYTQSTSERPFRSALLSLNKRWENCKWRGDPTVNIYFLFITCEWSSSLRKLGRNTWESAFAIPTSCSFHSFLHGVAGSVVSGDLSTAWRWSPLFLHDFLRFNRSL